VKLADARLHKFRPTNSYHVESQVTIMVRSKIKNILANRPPLQAPLLLSICNFLTKFYIFWKSICKGQENCTSIVEEACSGGQLAEIFFLFILLFLIFF
jgi:hypothetical protein